MTQFRMTCGQKNQMNIGAFHRCRSVNRLTSGIVRVAQRIAARFPVRAGAARNPCRLRRSFGPFDLDGGRGARLWHLARFQSVVHTLLL
jgi:hypothetical protein